MMKYLVYILFTQFGILGCQAQTTETMKNVEVIVLPEMLGEKEGKIIKWYVKEGDFVRNGQVLADLENKAATMELEAYTDGYILQIGAKENIWIEAGDLIAVIGDKNADRLTVENAINEVVKKKDDYHRMEGYIGEIVLFAGIDVPKDWMKCDGRILKVDENFDLYQVIGNKFGGDNRTSFGLPKLNAPADGLTYIICISGKKGK